MVSAPNRERGRCCRIEEWRDIAGFEGFYQVSNLGRVRSLDRTYVDAVGVERHYKGKYLTPCDDGKGYRNVMLQANGKRKTPRLCRIVATAFIPNPNQLPQVNHKDENKANDAAENLEWCTASYNTNYGTANIRRSVKHSKPVLQYDLNMNFIRAWESTRDVERELGIDNSHISRCCRGKLNQTGGFIWRYKNQTI